MVVKLVFAVACHIAPAAMIRLFWRDPQVIAVCDEYLLIVSWNFIAAGAAFVASQAFSRPSGTPPRR